MGHLKTYKKLRTVSKQTFKCRICKEKYDHDTMASEKDVSICKWCAQDEGYKWNF